MNNTLTIARINENGLQQIADALGEFHKFGRDHFTNSMLHAWASDAEDSFATFGRCEFEIKGAYTNSGAPEIVVITSDGYDVEELNDE